MTALSDYAADHSSSVFIETKVTKKKERKKIWLHLNVWLFKILLSVYMYIL